MVVLADFGFAARTTAFAYPLLRLVDESGADDTRGHSDDGVTEEHDEGGEEASHESDGGDVTITHRRHGHDGPIDAGADVGKVRARLTLFANIHEGTEASDEYEHEDEINQYLLQAFAQRLHEQITFVDEGEQLEHAEDANQSEGTEQDEVACSRDDEKDVGWECSEKVNDAEERKDVAAFVGRAIDASDVFQREKRGKHVFKDSERFLDSGIQRRIALNKNEWQAEHNRYHDGDVEDFASLCTGTKDGEVHPALIEPVGDFH